MLKNIIGIACVILVSLFVARHYITPGLPGTDDGIWAPVRLGSMYRELSQHQIPVRWSADLNFAYGYPLFHFSYPGVYYIGTIFVLAGLGIVDSVKLLFVAGIVSAAVGLSAVTRVLTRSTILSICASLLYAASPYVMTNLYRRGSIGEILAAGVLPWILLTILLNIKTQKSVFAYIAGMLIGALILIHNVSALLSLPLILLFIIWQAWENASHARSYLYKLHSTFLLGRHSLYAMVIGLLLASFFWVPAIVDVQHTKIANHSLTNIEEWFVSAEKTLFYPLFSAASPDNLDEYRLSIGIVHVCLIVFLMFFSIHRFGQTLWLIGVIITCVFLFPFSAVLWKIIPVYHNVDFPWRLLTPLSICIPITIASLANHRRWQLYLVGVGTAFALIIAIPWMQHRDVLDWPDSQFATNQATATANNEYLSKWMLTTPQSQPDQKIASLSGVPLTVTAEQEKSTLRVYTLRTDQPTEIEYALMYFPGWQLRINNNPTPINYQENGLTRFSVSAGESKVELQFVRTPMRLAFELISLSTFVIVLIGIFKSFIVIKAQKR